MTGRAQRPRRLLKWLLIPVVLAVTIIVVKTVAIDVFLVVEQSMWPGFHGDEDRILVQRLARNPRRWQVWLYQDEDASARPFVKRVVGLSGEFIDLRLGDVYVGKTPETMQRLRRPDEILDAMLIPVFPTPDGERGISRFNVSGSVTCDGDSLSLTGKAAAHLKSGLTSTEHENIRDDHLGNDGAFHAGDNIVGDVRVDCTIESVDGDGELRIWHDLRRGERRAVCVRDGELTLREGEGEEMSIRTLPWDGRFPLPVRMETIDGRFRVARLLADGTVEKVLVDEERDTNAFSGYSRVRLVLWRGGEARVSSLRVSRDVHWTWPPRRRHTGAYHVGEGYFFLGDNAPVSEDSRELGPVPEHRLFGRAWRIVWPAGRTRVLP